MLTNNIPLASGYSGHSDYLNAYWKSSNGVVTVVGAISSSTGHVYGAIMATLPLGFRPQVRTELPSMLFTQGLAGSYVFGVVRIGADGHISAAGEVPASRDTVYFTFTFVAS